MFSRYVALGDSSTEGLDDPDFRGGYRGWADRLAEHVASQNPEVAYANLAVRGRSAGEIHATQLAPALAMQPDLATVVAGMNDLLRTNWSAVRVAGHVGAMVRGLREIGTTVITFTIPDVSRRMKLGRVLSTRTQDLNLAIRDEVARAQQAGPRGSDAETPGRPGVLLLDLAAFELAHDPRMWAVDRLHGNPEGHTRIAAQLAFMLDIAGAEPGLAHPPAPMAPRRRREELAIDVAWIARFVAPWAWRRLRGRTTGDGITAKRPALAPVVEPTRSRRFDR
ncbi:MAG: SGNH/GDSL hydrolase family protein [Kofleriaceae bacterium]